MMQTQTETKQHNDQEKLILLRKVMGHAKVGVLASATLVEWSMRTAKSDPERFKECLTVLTHLRKRRMPSQASCRQAQYEVEDVLFPERALARKREEFGYQDLASMRHALGFAKIGVFPQESDLFKFNRIASAFADELPLAKTVLTHLSQGTLPLQSVCGEAQIEVVALLQKFADDELQQTNEAAAQNQAGMRSRRA